MELDLCRIPINTLAADIKTDARRIGDRCWRVEDIANGLKKPRVGEEGVVGSLHLRSKKLCGGEILTNGLFIDGSRCRYAT